MLYNQLLWLLSLKIENLKQLCFLLCYCIGLFSDDFVKENLEI